MKKPRKLTAREQALWDSVARQVTPLHETPEIKDIPIEEPKAKPKPEAKTEPPLRFDPFRVGEKAPEVRKGKSRGETFTAAPQMDAKAYGRMTRGKLKPEARIDLHGMTLDEAHPELIAFVLGSQSKGLRLVLVITGKGKIKPDDGHFPGRKGVLRHHVPQWLRLPPLAPAVLEVRPAHLRHGGEGAYYVYLRKAR